MRDRHHQYDKCRGDPQSPEKICSRIAELPTDNRTDQSKRDIDQKQESDVRGVPRQTHEIRQSFINDPSRIGDDRRDYGHNCAG